VWTAVVLCASLFTGAQSSSDAEEGEGEGEGEVVCERACLDANTLQFCDTGVASTLACNDVDDSAVCGFHSARVGFDCVLPAGAACDPAYAFGTSRCGPGLFCNALVCSTTAPAAAGDPEPTKGTKVDADATTTSCTSCAATDATAWLVMFTPALLVRWRRQRNEARTPKGVKRCRYSLGARPSRR
jgi:hypothetical protein